MNSPDLLLPLEPPRANSYVRVVPELALDKMFDYVLPSSLAGKVRAGHRLKVPWGRKTALAYAIEFPAEPQVAKCREVIELVSEEILLPPVLIQLARWMADYYCCDFNQCLRGMLPDVVRAKEDGFKQRYWVETAQGANRKTVLSVLKNAKLQRRAWEYLQDCGGSGWMAELSNECGATAAVWRALEEKGLVLLSLERMERNPLDANGGSDKALMLNSEQHAALTMILSQMDAEKPKPVMLRGVTGSGKTEVYLQALAEVLQRGKSGLILVPEISLTPQTVERFRRRFESMHTKVAVLHSHLSAGERHDQWQMIRDGRARIVIGARSAIFAPLMTTGIIIIDEEHEHTYKQEETPHYQARDLAVLRGAMENVPVVLGSATPSLETVYNAAQGKYLSAILSKRVEDIKMPVIHVLDLRKERPVNKQQPLIASALREAVTSRLAKGEQSIIFLNRRGYSTSLSCPKCGYVAECPHCSVPLTYHRSTAQICCHLCDHTARVPQACPECGFDQYKYAGTGTQKIEDAVVQLFPRARICRMDSDSMRGRHAFQQALQDFREGKTDILIGTQMIAKGLHFPNVTLVGIVNCDSALQLPDFRAAERVFQQMVQVAGRAGRGDKPGEVFIQSYTPFHPAIQFARHHDVEGFYDQELEFRRAHQYPPYRRSVLICFRGRSEEKTRFCIESATKRLREDRTLMASKQEVPDPAPAPIQKIRDHYRFHLFLMTGQMMTLSRVIKEQILNQEWPEDIRVTVDVDAVNML
ncbi:MAG: primosomal protein N' [Verrucomicrobiales bacterium]|jgi:primosomal protein N' (replication factor Y)|nr:primosomal protein N' [Verrucomicrobiales bacterium]